MKIRSIKTKLIIIFFLLIFIPMVLLGTTAYFVTYNSFEKTIKSSADQLVAISAKQMESKINGVQEYLRAMSSNSDIILSVATEDAAIRDRVFQLLSAEQSSNSDLIETFALVNNNSLCFLTNAKRNAALDLKDRAYIQEALAGNITISNVIQSKTSGNNVISIAVPLKQNGKVIGVLLSALNFEKLTEQVGKMKLGNEGYAYMLDNTGLTVSHPDKTQVLKLNIKDSGSKELQEIGVKMISGESGNGFYTYKGIEKYVSYYPVGNFSLALVDSKHDYMSSARIIGRIVIFLTLISLVVAMAIAIIFSSRMVNNIKMVKDAAERLAVGDADININQKTNDEIGQLIIAFKEMIMGIKQQSNIAKQISLGSFDVDIPIRSENDILNQSLKEMVHNINATYDEVKTIIQDVETGNFSAKNTTVGFVGGWKDIITGTYSILEKVNNYFDLIPLTIMTLNPNHQIVYLNETGRKLLDINHSQAIGQSCYGYFKTLDCNTENCACAMAMKEGKAVFRETTVQIGSDPMYISYIGIPMTDSNGDITGAFKVIMDQTDIKNAQIISEKQAQYQKEEVEKLVINLGKLAQGQLEISTSVAESDLDTEEIANNFRKINHNLENSTNLIKSYIKELSDILSEMAGKNFTVAINREYLGDFVQLKESINYIVTELNNVLGEINTASEQVESGASQVAATSENLSQGALEQASSVEEISASISQVAGQTKQNAVNANKANELSLSAKSDAQKGNERMVEMLSAMNDIKESSKNIRGVIKVIDDIAFQTNILALNAAVEAARAGQHGKGFAVVAEEVRNLAARSAKAANETTSLIDNSILKVEEGFKIANETAEALSKIVEGVSDAVGIVQTISEESTEQSKSITQIEQGVNQISGVTQTNSATAEESASASEEMAGQAQLLKGLIQAFKLKNEVIATKTIKTARASLPKIENNRVEIILDDDSFGKY